MFNLQKIKIAHERAMRKHGAWVADEGTIYTAERIINNEQGFIIQSEDIADSEYVALSHNMMPTLLASVEALKNLYTYATKKSIGGEAPEDVKDLFDSCKSVLERL